MLASWWNDMFKNPLGKLPDRKPPPVVGELPGRGGGCGCHANSLLLMPGLLLPSAAVDFAMGSGWHSIAAR